MMQRSGHLALAEASRYMQRLCFHFSKKVSASATEDTGLVDFPWGSCRMRSDGTGIHFLCQAEDQVALQRVVHVIDEHVKLFARRETLLVQWATED